MTIKEQPVLPGLSTPLEEGEPTFTLRGRDSLAPGMVALWAALAAGDTSGALSIFSELNSQTAYDYRNEPRTPQKINSASDLAIEMNEWRKNKELRYNYSINSLVPRR